MDCVKKPEETHAGTERKKQISHRQVKRQGQTRTCLLWGNCANHCTILPHIPCKQYRHMLIYKLFNSQKVLHICLKFFFLPLLFCNSQNSNNFNSLHYMMSWTQYMGNGEKAVCLQSDPGSFRLNGNFSYWWIQREQYREQKVSFCCIVWKRWSSYYESLW